MGVEKSLLEILNQDNGSAVMDLQRRIVPWDRSAFPREFLRSHDYVNVPGIFMPDAEPVPKDIRFVFDRHGHFFAQHCGLYLKPSYTEQLSPAVEIDTGQYEEESRRMLWKHGDNHFTTLEKAVLRHNMEGATTVVVGRMPWLWMPLNPNLRREFVYIYVESGQRMKPDIVSLINGSKSMREEEPIILCSDSALEKRERMPGFEDKAHIMVPGDLFSYID